MFFDPQAHTARGVSYDTVIRGIRRAQMAKSEVITAMLEAGMWVTVNSGDPAYFPGYMNENLIWVQEEVNLDKAEIVQLAENAFESAWLPRATKDRYIAELKTYAG